MLGYTGAGKSCLANEILGKELFVTSESMKSVTKHIDIRENKIMYGRVKVVDVPGFGDSEGCD